MKITCSIVILGVTCFNSVWASIDINNTLDSIYQQRDAWYRELSREVLIEYPLQGSAAAEWDRQVSNQYREIIGERKKLADQDKNQSSDYIYRSFASHTLGEHAEAIDLRTLNTYSQIASLYKSATYTYDAHAGRLRSFDFVLKDHFMRGRPYQVIDDKGNYIDDYAEIKGSSFPSGHTWSGFRQAIGLALVFPELGRDIYSRALQFGESRVIVGAHFPTDTIASRIGSYFSLAQLLADENIAAALTSLAKDVRNDIAILCQSDVRQCVSAQPRTRDKTDAGDQGESGYYGKRENHHSLPITPDEIPLTAANLLRFRFPYLNAEDRNAILAGTAYPRDSLAGWAIQQGRPDSFWGVIDLPRSHDGPAYLYRSLVVNQIPDIAHDVADFSQWDEWKNNISGPGKLIKHGEGVLTLSGNNDFSGVEMNQGTMILVGNNKFSGGSLVNGGTLIVNGTLDSALDVNNGGLLSGRGTIKTLRVHRGGILKPGASIGTLEIKDSITFEAGSGYAVEVASNGKSDGIRSAGTALLKGGNVAVSLENDANLLPATTVQGLLGNQYNILEAQQGVSGQFASVTPNYLFLGTVLTYQPNRVRLSVGRSAVAFASVAETANERTVAAAADRLYSGHPVYESILTTGSADEARQAFRQLSGQIHSDIASALVNDSRYLRDTLNDRLRQAQGLAGGSAIKADEDGAWGQLLGVWNHASGDGSATGYRTSSYGVLLGLDGAYDDGGCLGVATGYTRTQLNGGYGSNAGSENYHLGVYGDTGYGSMALRAGGSHTWHRINTSRTVNYGAQSSQEAARYAARTQQVFVEAGYGMGASWLSLEPFVNLSYISFRSGGIAEGNGAAALYGERQSTDAVMLTLGLRADRQWQFHRDSALELRGEAGWQHQYGERERGTGLRFRGSDVTFVNRSVPVSRDGLVLKASVEVSTGSATSLSLGYSGLLSDSHQDSSVNAGFTWHF